MFEYELYDKRNAFQFPIVRFPFGDSNMPSKMFYATIGTEILRICRASSKYQTFINHCIPFIARMSNQLAKRNRMRGIVKTIGGGGLRQFFWVIFRNDTCESTGIALIKFFYGMKK